MALPITSNKRIVMPRDARQLEDAAFHSIHAPFMSLPNPSGTVESFIEALRQEDEDEALGYLSQTVMEMADLDEMKRLFCTEGKYHFFSEDAGSGIRTVALATSNRSDSTEVIFVRMVAEPDDYGKWKIYSVEKEQRG